MYIQGEKRKAEAGDEGEPVKKKKKKKKKAAEETEEMETETVRSPVVQIIFLYFMLHKFYAYLGHNRRSNSRNTFI